MGIYEGGGKSHEMGVRSLESEKQFIKINQMGTYKELLAYLMILKWLWKFFL
jgi:hypothetical protein